MLHVTGLRVDEVVRVILSNTEAMTDDGFWRQFASKFSGICEAAISDVLDEDVVSWVTGFIKPRRLSNILFLDETTI